MHVAGIELEQKKISLEERDANALWMHQHWPTDESVKERLVSFVTVPLNFLLSFWIQLANCKFKLTHLRSEHDSSVCIQFWIAKEFWFFSFQLIQFQVALFVLNVHTRLTLSRQNHTNYFFCTENFSIYHCYIIMILKLKFTQSQWNF